MIYISFYIPLLLITGLFIVKFPKKCCIVCKFIGMLCLGLVNCFLFGKYEILNEIYLDFLLLFFVVIITVYVCCDISLKQLTIYGIAAVMVQNITSNFCAIIFYKSDNWYIQYSVLFVCIIIVFYYVFIKKVRGDVDLNIKNYRLFLIIPVVLATIFFISPNILGMDQQGACMARVLMILLEAALLFVEFDTFVETRLYRENETLELLLQVEKEQQKMAAENIEIINSKCHDLKHQISAVKKIMDRKEQSEYIDELEKSVMIYDSIAKTGNQALDIILTEKSLICDKYGIRLSYIADGEQMNFMRTSDIYTIFGNGLDNAIEALKTTEDLDKRLINLYISAKNNFLIIHMENYLPEEVELQEGFPQTRKKNKQYHGFGLKSISYVVEKYKGVLDISADNKMFLLDITIPFAK